MWYFRKEYESDVKADGKTVVITGGNAGIGKETARDLYKRGARVIILSRDQQKCQEAINEIKSETKQLNEQHDIRSKFLDLADLSSVRKCAKEILEEEKEINILINNAGIFGHKTKITKDGFEVHFQINYLGHFLLTLLLLPRIKKSGSGRIVNVASVGQKFPYFSRTLGLTNKKTGRWWIFQIEANCQAKLAQVLFTKELARKLKDAGIENVTAYSLHPGIIQTELNRDFGTLLWGLRWVWEHAGQLVLMTPKQGAATTLYCALDEKLANESGLYYSNCAEDSVNRLAKSPELAKELWEKSLEFVGLTDYDIVKSMHGEK